MKRTTTIKATGPDLDVEVKVTLNMKNYVARTKLDEVARAWEDAVARVMLNQTIPFCRVGIRQIKVKS